METNVHALETLPSETPDSDLLEASGCTPTCDVTVTSITHTRTF